MSALAKVIILCGGKLAFPAIQTLALHGHLAGIGIGGGAIEAVQLLESESQRSGLPFMACHTRADMGKLLAWLDGIKADAVFCICFPYKLPKDMLQKPALKCINFHTGPLPQYRGPMPLFEVLKNQEATTALTLHFMEADYDTGPIIYKEPIVIDDNETFGSLAVKMSLSVGQSVLNLAQMLTFGSTIPCHPQSEAEAQYYPKPERRDTQIRWRQMQACEIVALVNACNPWNVGADTLVNGHSIKVVASTLLKQQHQQQPGAILALDALTGLHVACIEDHIVSLDIISTDLGITAGHLIKSLGIRIGHQFA